MFKIIHMQIFHVHYIFVELDVYEIYIFTDANDCGRSSPSEEKPPEKIWMRLPGRAVKEATIFIV